MKIILTGASSFTGYWFARTLVERGHQVVATFTKAHEDYVGLRATRVNGLPSLVDRRFNLPMGSDGFVQMIGLERPDVLCLHGAEVGNYRSLDFDCLEAVKRNTKQARAILQGLPGHALVLFTGSVFEPYEGFGDPFDRAFNPYGLSKMFSYEIFRLEAENLGLAILKFIIPNPFGPFEEPRFTQYMVSEWSAGRVPRVMTPRYVRDNIHVDLLAEFYALVLEQGFPIFGGRVHPSGYVETQGEFSLRFAKEMSARWHRELSVEFAAQNELVEPLVRVNNLPTASIVSSWSQERAWDRIAEFYEGSFPRRV